MALRAGIHKTTAGKLDQRVTILEKRQERQANGTLAVTFVPRFTVWAHVRPKSGMQRNHAQKTENPADYEITIKNSRQAQAAKPDDVLDWRGQRMNIVWIGYTGSQSMYLQIDARAGVAV